MINDVLQIRVDKKLKNNVSTILDNMGLDMSTAIRMFFTNIVKTKNIPFDISADCDVNNVNKKITIEDLNKYMGIGKSSFKNASDIDKYLKESRRDRKFY